MPRVQHSKLLFTQDLERAHALREKRHRQGEEGFTLVELRLRITGSRSRSAYRSKVSSEAGTPGACAVRVVEWVYLGLIVISSTPSGTTLSPKPTFALAPAMAEHGQAALDGRSRFCRANRMQARDARGTLPDIALEALWCAP